MIFAVLDYIRYRKHKGRYSFTAIEKSGARLATIKNFPKPEKIPPLSTMFHHCFNSFICWLIMYYTSSVWAHTAMFVKDGYLVDMTLAGVIKRPFSDYLDGNGYLKVYSLRDLKKEDWEKVVAIAEKDIGKEYGYLGVVIEFFKINLAFKQDYRFRFSLDILIIFGLFCMLSSFFKIKVTALITIVFWYMLIVLINIFRLRFSGKEIKF